MIIDNCNNCQQRILVSQFILHLIRNPAQQRIESTATVLKQFNFAKTCGEKNMKSTSKHSKLKRKKRNTNDALF